MTVASQLIKEVTAHAQSDSLEDARQTCADVTYFPNNLRRVKSSMRHASVYEGKSHTNPSYFNSVNQTVVASVNAATPSCLFPSLGGRHLASAEYTAPA